MAASKSEQTKKEIDECGKYYDVLYDFDKSVRALNTKAMNGEKVKCLQKYFIKLIPAFVSLCGDGECKGKRKGRKKMENNLTVIKGFGLCPVCNKKCIKVNDDTVLANYPMYCKVCKRDYVVNWKATGRY